MSFLLSHPVLAVLAPLVLGFVILVYAMATAPLGEEIEGLGFIEFDDFEEKH